MTDRILEHLPRIDIVAMGRATRVPDWYPDVAATGCVFNDFYDIRIVLACTGPVALRINPPSTDPEPDH